MRGEVYSGGFHCGMAFHLSPPRLLYSFLQWRRQPASSLSATRFSREKPATRTHLFSHASSGLSAWTYERSPPFRTTLTRLPQKRGRFPPPSITFSRPAASAQPTTI